jgi:hypothetical protein
MWGTTATVPVSSDNSKASTSSFTIYEDTKKSDSKTPDNKYTSTSPQMTPCSSCGSFSERFTKCELKESKQDYYRRVLLDKFW